MLAGIHTRYAIDQLLFAFTNETQDIIEGDDADQTITITVGEVNDPPVLTSIQCKTARTGSFVSQPPGCTPLARAADDGETFQLQCSASDVDGGNLTYAWSQQSGPGATIGPPSSATLLAGSTFTVDTQAPVRVAVPVSLVNQARIGRECLSSCDLPIQFINYNHPGGTMVVLYHRRPATNLPSPPSVTWQAVGGGPVQTLSLATSSTCTGGAATTQSYIFYHQVADAGANGTLSIGGLVGATNWDGAAVLSYSGVSSVGPTSWQSCSSGGSTYSVILAPVPAATSLIVGGATRVNAAAFPTPIMTAVAPATKVLGPAGEFYSELSPGSNDLVMATADSPGGSSTFGFTRTGDSISNPWSAVALELKPVTLGDTDMRFQCKVDDPAGASVSGTVDVTLHKP
jgi:hypothetical protein